MMLTSCHSCIMYYVGIINSDEILSIQTALQIAIQYQTRGDDGDYGLDSDDDDDSDDDNDDDSDDDNNDYKFYDDFNDDDMIKMLMIMMMMKMLMIIMMITTLTLYVHRLGSSS